jgi:hypothetical protein
METGAAVQKGSLYSIGAWGLEFSQFEVSIKQSSDGPK